jgi:hypothetical protein
VGCDVADKHFTVCLDGIPDGLSRLDGCIRRLIAGQFIAKRFNGRQMLFSGSAPGNVLKQGQNFFGDAPAARMHQAAGVSHFLELMDRPVNRTGLCGHGNSLGKDS